MQTWTEADIKRAIKTLSHSATVTQAAEREGVTPAAMRAAFQRGRERGFDYGCPADYLQGPGAIQPPTKRHDGRTIMVWPDTHAPYHDPEAVAVALAVLKAVKPDALVILGDFFDCYSVSRFPKDPARKTRLRDELDGGLPILDAISASGVPLVHFLQGNHEVRIESLIEQQAPALHGMISLRKEMRIAERGWHWTNYKQSLKLGRMLYSHDFGRSGVHAAYQGLSDIGGNICFGHTHKLGTSYRGHHTALNCGWLGDVGAVDYRHADIARREYQLGFGLVDEAPDGCVWPQAVAIVKGAAMVRGKRVTA